MLPGETLVDPQGFLVAGFLYPLLDLAASFHSMKQEFICKACGFTGTPIKKKKGNGWIELILWFCFGIPGLIYSIWRRSNRPKVCARCGSGDVIPTDTPVGKKLVAEGAI